MEFSEGWSTNWTARLFFALARPKLHFSDRVTTEILGLTAFPFRPSQRCLCFRDCLITSAVNSFTSLLSGFVVFCYLGYMSTVTGKDIEFVATEGEFSIFASLLLRASLSWRPCRPVGVFRVRSWCSLRSGTPRVLRWSKASSVFERWATKQLRSPNCQVSSFFDDLKAQGDPEIIEVTKANGLMIEKLKSMKLVGN